jgi:NADPH:quinone reductase-like Zn-dependent oxidoreductase
MLAIVITRHGGPDVLRVRELPDPVPADGEILIRNKAFGLNRAEIYMRDGSWGDLAPVPGIECAGLVESDPSGQDRRAGRGMNAMNATQARVLSVNVGGPRTFETPRRPVTTAIWKTPVDSARIVCRGARCRTARSRP